MFWPSHFRLVNIARSYFFGCKASGNFFQKRHVCLKNVFRLHVLRIYKNIHSKGTAHVQAPKQDCANHTGSQMHVF